MKNSDYVYFNYASTEESAFFYKRLGLEIKTKIFYIGDGNEEFFYVPYFELDYLKKYSRYIGIRNIGDLPGADKSNFNAIIYQLKRYGKTIAVPAIFPAWFILKLQKNGLEVVVNDYYFFHDSLCKDKDEIGYVKDTGKNIKECFGYIGEIFDRASVKNGLIYLDKEILSAKSMVAFVRKFLLQRNIDCRFISIASGKYSYFPHCQINHPLKANEPVVIDIGANNFDNGFFVDVSRTFCIGKPKNSEFLKLYESIMHVKNYFEKSVRPGRLIVSVYEEVKKIMEKDGIFVVKIDEDPEKFVCHHALGHGIGREIHELPVVDGRAKVNFERNMMIALEPGAYKKNIGGVRIEDTYLVTAEGVENLTAGNYNFLIDKDGK